jgi:FkbM family methyltransferase
MMAQPEEFPVATSGERRENVVISAVRAVFKTMGYTINRIPGDEQYRFGPRPEDRYKWIQGMGIRTILDVGAHAGESVEQFAALFPEAMIYSFEPLRDCFRLLQAKIADRANHKAFNVALGDKPGRGEIHRSAFSPSSSLLEMTDLHKKAYPFSANGKIEPIEIRTLDTVAPELKLESTVLLKIDTQGFEKNVLLGGERTLPQIKIIIVETSFEELYRGQPRFPEIYHWLEERGLEYRGSWEQFNNPKDGMPIQQDGIFIRI